MILRELFAKLSLTVDEASFAKGTLAAEAVKYGLGLLVNAAAGAVRGIADLARETVAYASEVNDTSQAIGVTTSALQELRYAAGLSGVGAQELDGAINVLTRTMRTAKEGGEEAAGAFSKAGVRITDSSGKLRTADEVLGDVAERFATLPNGAEKSALAMQLFGRSGARMVPFLNEGSKGIAALREEARELGAVLDEETIRAGDELGDTFDRLHTVWEGIKRAVGASVIPQMLEAAQATVKWVRANREMIKLALTKVLGGIVTAATAVGKALAFAARQWRFFASAAVVALTALLPAAAAATVAGLKLAAAWLIANAPFLLVAAAVAAVAAALEDLWVTINGGDSLIGRHFPEFAKSLRENKSLVVDLRRAWDTVVESIKTALRFSLKLLEALGVIRGEQRTQTRNGGGAVVSTDAAGSRTITGGNPFAIPIGAPGDRTELSWPARISRFLGGDPFGQPTIPAPQMPGGAGVRSQTNQITVIQQPGQSGEDLAAQIDRRIRASWDGEMEAAAAAE